MRMASNAHARSRPGTISSIARSSKDRCATLRPKAASGSSLSTDSPTALPALVLGIALAAVVPAMRWLVAALSLTYLVNIVAVYRLSDAFGFRSASPRVDELVLLVSAVNLFLLLVSYAYGVALARAGEQDEATATRRASGQVVTVAKGQG